MAATSAMTVAMAVTMLMIVIAEGACRDELTTRELLSSLGSGSARTEDDIHTRTLQVVESSLAHTAGYDNIRALALQESGESAAVVSRALHVDRTGHSTILYIEDVEVRATPEVR